MIRTVLLSVAATGANFFLFVELQIPQKTPISLLAAGALSLIVTTILIRHARRRGARRAMHALVHGNETIDLILNEVEKNQAQRDSRPARRE